MVRLFTILFITFAFSHVLSAQRLSAGWHLGTSVWETIDLKEDFIFPEYSYNVFYTVNENDNSKYSSLLSGYQVGIYLQTDLKRFFIGTEFNVSKRNYFANVIYAIDNDWAIFNTPGQVELNVTQYAFEVPLFLGVKLLERTNNVSLYFGGSYAFGISSQEEGMLNMDSDFSVSAFLGFYELYGIVYNNIPFWRALGGVGANFGNHMFSLRYEQRLDSEKNRILASNYCVSLHWNWILTFQKLKKGHYIYTK